jgi:hypothetical protein
MPECINAHVLNRGRIERYKNDKGSELPLSLQERFDVLGDIGDSNAHFHPTRIKGLKVTSATVRTGNKWLSDLPRSQ